MGQDLRDCHNIWKRCVQRKVVFTKQTAIGREHHYKWEMFEAIRPEKFRLVGSGTKKYDKKYYGTYASHSDGTTQTSAVMDDCGIIWKRPGFKYGIPAAIAIAAFAISHLVDFFSPDDQIVQKPKPPVTQQVPKQPIAQVPKRPLGRVSRETRKDGRLRQERS